MTKRLPNGPSQNGATGREENAPTLLGEAIAELLWRRGLRGAERRRQLEAAWQRAVSQDWARHLRLGSWRGGVLEVWVGDAAIFHRLAQFERENILHSLQRELGPGLVTRLRFRMG